MQCKIFPNKMNKLILNSEKELIKFQWITRCIFHNQEYRNNLVKDIQSIKAIIYLKYLELKQIQPMFQCPNWRTNTPLNKYPCKTLIKMRRQNTKRGEIFKLLPLNQNTNYLIFQTLLEIVLEIVEIIVVEGLLIVIAMEIALLSMTLERGSKHS